MKNCILTLIITLCLLMSGATAETIPAGETTDEAPRVYTGVGGEVSGVGTGPFIKNKGLRGAVSVRYSPFSPAETFAGSFWRSHDYA